jgi:predicted AlkP superfamily phosphohydrolase/phosphomutase
VIRPLAAAGALPNLSAWMEAGIARPLPSTTPPVTFPAWSTFMTGREPGRHGVFDFTHKVPGQYRIRFVNAADRVGETLFGAVSRAGGRVLVLGMPATYPPSPVEGLLVPGFDAPVSTGSDADSTTDPALYRRIAERAGPWMRPDIDESARDPGFHERAVGTLLARIERKKRFALAALDEMTIRDGRRPDLVTVVFAESDTVGHHYWRDHDPASPRHDPGASPARRGAVAAVYRALDAACGEIRDAYGHDAPCIVVSDHGMGGASRYVVHLNRRLADSGLLARRPGRATARDAVARRARDAALRILPPRLAQRLFRRARGAAARLESAARFGGIDWARTDAFSEETNTLPGVWINLAGREAEGRVPAGGYEAARDRVIEALETWRLPDGGPVVARAVRREAVYDGPFVDRAPDVLVELALARGYGLSVVPTPWGTGESAVRTLADDELAGGRGRGMNGTHRSEGIWIAVGPSSLAAREPLGAPPERLADVAPFLARTMGLPWPPGGAADADDTARPYTDEEDAIVAARLRALGYLE